MSRIKNLRIIKHFKDSVNGKIHGIYTFDFSGGDENMKDLIVIRHEEEIKDFSFCLERPINKCLRNIKKDVEKELIEEVEKEIKERDNFEQSAEHSKSKSHRADEQKASACGQSET